MNTIEKMESIKNEIAEVSKRIVDKDYKTVDEKHELQKKRWLLKRMLSAIQDGSDSSYLSLFEG